MDTHILAPSEAVQPPLSPRYAARLYGVWNWLGLQTLVRREVMRFIKVAGQTLIAPLMQTLLFMAVFAFAFPGRHWTGLPNVPYVDGLAPGLIMMSVLTNAFQNTSSSMVQAKLMGTSVDFLMPPVSALELTIAFIAGATLRGLLVGAAGLVAVAAFADVIPVNPLLSLYFAVCASLMFAAIGLIGGIWAEKFDSLAAVTNFVVMPLTFLSGTFFSPAVLPAPFGALLSWNPVFFLMDGFRAGFIGAAHADLRIAAAVSALLAGGLCWACWAVLKSGYRLKA